MAANLVGSATFSTAPGFVLRNDMNKLNRSLIATVLLGSVATPTFAEQKQASELPAFESADYVALFDTKSKGAEVASLSNKEMKETEGSFRNYVINGWPGLTIFSEPRTANGQSETVFNETLPNGQSITVIKGQSANGQSISVQSSLSSSGNSSVSVSSRSSVTSSGGGVSANVVSQVGSSGTVYTYNYSSNGSHPSR